MTLASVGLVSATGAGCLKQEERIDALESQLARRSQLEEKIEDLPAKVRDAESEPDAPFFVQWYQCRD